MCEPTYYGVDYVINPWMTNNVGQVNKPLAAMQWDILYKTLKAWCNVELITPQPGLPDMVFTANAGLPLPDKSVIISQFKNVQRQPETAHFSDWFVSKGYTSITIDDIFEGAGDCLVDSNETYWFGHGIRSTKPTIEITKWLPRLADNHAKVFDLKLVDPRWYHLDTCFCPLPRGHVMYNPQAFDSISRDLIEFMFDGKTIISHDPSRFECNAVSVSDRGVVLNNPSMETAAGLRKAGFYIVGLDLSEFIKAGGSAKCLTLEI